jgi:hypothetical protein
VRHLDLAAMFASLWLLASMVLDVITPKDLSVYMIGATLAPPVAVLALLYWKKVPRFDFVVALATLWMVTGIVLELITPTPMSPIAAIVAIAPLVAVGIAVHVRRWRRPRSPSGSTRLSS